MSVTSHEWTKKILNYDLLCLVLNFRILQIKTFKMAAWVMNECWLWFSIAKLPHLSCTYSITNIYRFQENSRSPQVQQATEFSSK